MTKKNSIKNPVRMQVTGVRLPPDVELAILRIAQKAKKPKSDIVRELIQVGLGYANSEEAANA